MGVRRMLIVITAVLTVYSAGCVKRDMGEKPIEQEVCPVVYEKYDIDAAPERIMDDIIAAYKDFNVEGFRAFLSDVFEPSQDYLISRVERNYYKEKVMDIKYKIKKVERNDGRMKVYFSWEKGVLPYKNGEAVDSKKVAKKGDGMFEFVYEREMWLLRRVSGGIFF